MTFRSRRELADLVNDTVSHDDDALKDASNDSHITSVFTANLWLVDPTQGFVQALNLRCDDH